MIKIQSSDLSLNFGCGFQKKPGFIMSGKEPHFPQNSHDIIIVFSLMKYSDITKYNKVGDSETPLLRCFSFLSKIKIDDIISTGQYINSRSYTNLQLTKLFKKTHSKVSR